jgi:biopolymer transport protein ExbB
MNRSAAPKRSSVKLTPDRPRRSYLGLLTHLAPVVVLTIGMSWWMSAMNPANGQNNFSSGPFGGQFSGAAQSATQTGGYPGQPMYDGAAQPQYRTAQNPAGGSIPPAPQPEATATEAIGGESEGSDQSEGSGSWFQPPAFVTKVMSGGWLMLPLGICSLVVLTLSMERLIALRRSRVIPKPFVRRFTECVEDGVLSYDEATELCKEFDCPVSEVFRAALRRWGRPMLEIEQAVMDAGDRVSDGLKKYLRVFHAISNVAPLIGLLGTVIGMIDAFEAISDQQSIGRPETLASGISMALMTTAGGLAVAIPAYLAYMYFASKSDRYLGEIEKLCQRVIDCISAEGLENAGGTRSKKRKAA